MLIPLKPMEERPVGTQCRQMPRYAPTDARLASSVLASDGKRYPTSVLNLSPMGAKLSGGFPATTGDRIDVDVQLNTALPAVKMPAVVVRHEAIAIAVRFQP